MYTPPYFAVTDPSWALDLIERHPFGLLVTGELPYPRVSHIPLVAQERDGKLWCCGHVARENPHSQSILEQSSATLVFTGPHAYVSASWYEAPYATVPTWNYATVHLCGRLKPYDPWAAVERLSEKMEGAGAGAWDPERLEPRYRDGMLRAIVAFELFAEVVYAKAKLSQNRSDADRERVIARLATSDDQIDRECATAMALTSDVR
jgi:transcriptional regulator